MKTENTLEKGGHYFGKALVELPAFDLPPPGHPPEAAIQAYERDGVVCLRRAFEDGWVESLREGVDRAIADGLKSGGAQAVNVTNPGEPGFFFYAMFLWKRYDIFKEFAFDSPAADLARETMRSETMTFYYDLQPDAVALRRGILAGFGRAGLQSVDRARSHSQANRIAVCLGVASAREKLPRGRFRRGHRVQGPNGSAPSGLEGCARKARNRLCAAGAGRLPDNQSSHLPQRARANMPSRIDMTAPIP